MQKSCIYVYLFMLWAFQFNKMKTGILIKTHLNIQNYTKSFFYI